MNGSGSDVLGQQQQQQEEDDLRLKVGAIVAYECLLDDTIGTTSWRIGAVRALATPAVCTSPSDGFNPTSEPVKGNSNTAEEEGEGSGALAASEKPMTPSPPSPPIPRTHLTSSLSSITLTRKTTCQTAEIQPWISLATATPAAYRSHNKDEEGDYNSCSVGPAMTNGESLSPSSVAVGAAGAAGGSPRLLSAGGPSACLAEMNAVQTSLKEEKEKEEGMPLSAHSDAPSGAEDDEDRLAKALSAAYTRVLTATTSRDGERGRSTSSAISEASAAVAADPSLQRQIEAKRAEFRVRIEQTLADLQQTRQQQHDLQKAQEKAQTQLQHARQHLREAQEKVQEIDVRALKEIQGYRLPPAVVQLVMSAVLCVLGEKASTWSEVVTVMRTPSFIARVALYDPAQLTQARLEEVKKKYIAERNFSHAVAMKGSQALGQFQEWVMRQAQLADADGSLARFLAQKESSTAALAVARQKIAAGAAELECLEAELDALLHEQGRQQQQQQQQKEEEEEELRKSTGGVISANGAAVPSPRPPEAGAQQRGTPKEPQASQQQQPTTTTNSSPATPRSRSRQLSPRFAKDKLSFGSPIPTTSAVASSTTQTPPGANNTVGQPQQQLHVSPLPPPGSQWLCPPAGAVHNTYVLRSSILCVLGYTSSDDAVPLAGSVFTLTNKQQQLVCEAMEKPLHARPLVPLTAKEAAAEMEAARPSTVTTHHTVSFEGEDWEMVLEDSPEELRRAIVDDVAAICQVPNRAVTGVEWVLGSLHVRCDVCHPASVAGDALQQALEDGAYPTVMAHYEGRQQRRDSLDEDAARRLQQARRLALMEDEIQAAQQAEADARRQLTKMRANFERQQQALAEQVAVAQTSSQMDFLEDAREHLALREAMHDVQAALKERDAQVAQLQACLRSLEKAVQSEAEGKGVDVAARLAAAERRAKTAEDKAQEAQQRADAEKLAHQQELKNIQQSSMKETAKEAAAEVEAARPSTVTTHHTVSFEGEDWEMVLEDSPEELRRAIVDDVAAICQVPNRAVTGVEWVLGSLHVRCDVCHPASVAGDALQQALEDGAYPTVMAHYEGRQQRRSQREAEAAIAAQQRQHMKDLKQQLLDALAAQTSQQNTVQGLELTHTAALQQAQQTQQQHAAEVKEAENAAAEAERQLHAAHAALQEQAKMHQEEVEKLLGQLAQREEALHQLQEAHTSAQAAVRRCETRVKQQQEGDEAQPRELTQRWGQVQVQDTHSKLVEALQAQLHATETASSSSRLEQQRHADAAAAAAVRRNERRAALEDISHKIQILAKRMPVIPSGPSTAKSNEGTAAQPQHVNPAKVALGRELAVQLHAMTKEKADVAAAVAQSRRATTHHQRAVEAAAAEVQRRRRALHEAVGGGTGSMASTASAGNEEEQDGLAALYAEVAAASQRCTASMQNLTVQEEQRLQACAEEEAEVSRILQRMNASGSRDAVAQLMREVHNRATSSFLQRHQTAWMNTCLCGLLFAAVATLQYKKYAV